MWERDKQKGLHARKLKGIIDTASDLVSSFVVVPPLEFHHLFNPRKIARASSPIKTHIIIDIAGGRRVTGEHLGLSN